MRKLSLLPGDLPVAKLGGRKIGDAGDQSILKSRLKSASRTSALISDPSAGGIIT